MSDMPVLLFLHGVGPGDQEDEWKVVLDGALAELGYPDLDPERVIAPKYPNALRGADDDDPLPRLTVKALSGEAAKRNRRDFERRMGAIEIMVARHDRGVGWVGGELIVDMALALPHFVQARNYITNNRIRAQVLNRILRQLPKSGRLVIVGHSLGSVIAADLVRRLPVGLDVVGMVTIGSPLAHPRFEVAGLRETLTEPPANLAWWVNFWNAADPVAAHRGLSSSFPWMVDHRIQTSVRPDVHDAGTYLASQAVAAAIGYALFGSRSKELAVVDKGLDIRLDLAETVALMALRYGYLIKTKLEGDRQERFANALRQVQADVFDRIKERNDRERRPLPTPVAGLAVDLSDPQSVAPEPSRINHLTKEDAVVALVSLAASNVIRPFEISVPQEVRREALEDLTIEMGLGRQFGSDVAAASRDARRALSGDGTNWIKWAALSVGAAAIVVATGGLALAAAPGVAGAAAITSALAAFGPGGMIGGLLTAGALVSAGGGGIAIGIASPMTTAAAVEAIIAAQLAAAILRRRQGLKQDPATWTTLVEIRIELRRERARLETCSDDSAPTLKELKRKLDALDRALSFLTVEGLGPNDAVWPDAGENPAEEFLDRAAALFVRVDLDGDGIPDKTRVHAAVEDAGSAIMGAAAGVADAFSSLFQPKRAATASRDDEDSEPSD